MRTPKLLAHGVIRRVRSGRGRAGPGPGSRPSVCPVARCARCGYAFTSQTVSAVCPRCLEPFLRDPCYGGCLSCPLLARATKPGQAP